MQTIFQVARRDFWHLLKQPATLVWAFAMPVLFFSFIGKITSRFAPGPESKDKIGVLIPAGSGFLGDALVRRLEAVQYAVRPVKNEEELSRYDRQLVLPPGLTAMVMEGKPAKLKFGRRGEPGMSGDYDNVRLARATYGLLAEVIAANRKHGTLTAAGLAEIEKEALKITIEVQPAGKRKDPPTGYQQSVPGVLVMFVLTVMLTSGGISIVTERRLGILRRLASSPMTRGSVVATKWGSRVALGIVQTLVGAALGTAMYHIEWGEAWWAAAALLGLYLALCGSLGLLLGSLATSEGQAAGISVIAGNLLAALGGCWWPQEISPVWMQKFGLCLPTGLTMDGLHRLMSFGEPASAVLPHMAALAVATLVIGWLAARAFRFQ